MSVGWMVITSCIYTEIKRDDVHSYTALQFDLRIYIEDAVLWGTWSDFATGHLLEQILSITH